MRPTAVGGAHFFSLRMQAHERSNPCCASSAERALRAVYEAGFEAVFERVKTVDLGGSASTTECADAIMGRVRTKVGGACWAKANSQASQLSESGEAFFPIACAKTQLTVKGN